LRIKIWYSLDLALQSNHTFGTIKSKKSRFEMDKPIRRKIFKYGNDVAFRLPEEYGIKPGDKLELVKTPRGAILHILSSEQGSKA
jgi:hypothetical protein